MRIVMEDGTLLTPALDPETAERLSYVIDNLVVPDQPPSA